MKYIIFELETSTKDIKMIVPIVFPKELNHIDVSDAIKKIPNLSEIKPVSAGFCSASFLCSGDSETLGLSSRQEDAQIINSIDYFPFDIK